MPHNLQFALGLEGLALLRAWLTGDETTVDELMRELIALAQSMGTDAGLDHFVAPELAVPEGYGLWAGTYDEPRNPIIWLEEPPVRELLRAAPPGRALDAACGTGRLAAYLAELGHQVVGIDRTPAMLATAQRKLSDVPLCMADLNELPLATLSVDLAVCSLALTHVADLHRPIRELARVVRAGGRIVLSDVHPTAVALGAQGFFHAVDGSRGFVRNHVHLVSAYLDAFAGAGLRVERCLEPVFGAREAAAMFTSVPAGPLAREALVGIPSILIWDLRVL